MKYKFVVEFYINGVFKCHIEEQDTSKVIWTCEDDEWNEHYEFRSWKYNFSESGNMKDMTNTDGLKKELVMCGIIPSDSVIEFDTENFDKIVKNK